MSPIGILIVLIVIALVALCVHSQLRAQRVLVLDALLPVAGTHHGGDGHCGVVNDF